MAAISQSVPPARPLSFSEGEKLRDRMNADEDKSTDTLSTIARSIAVGLALIIYAFFVQKDQSEFVSRYFGWLLIASVFGVMAVTADALQYLSGMLQVRRLRGKIKQHLAANEALSIVALDKYTKNVFYALRNVMFWSKLVLVAFGTALIIVIISRAAFHALVG